MNQYFAYIRVSTVKQGEQGVSLQQQRDAIERYAQHNSQEIVSWFKEQETAAKRGRPIFNQMMKLLGKQKVSGVIMHKIDRGARNLKDWADLGELIDQGVEVHFANESLDLHSRGGRLSADIQAVVAADYVRNLREETRKGFYGRLKQGLFPMPAPIGYLNKGKGQPKVPDPARAPLVRRAFELYATGNYNLHGLVDELFQLGLRTNSGRKVEKNGVSTILNNPFYTGLIRLKRTKETFPGIHEPLISSALFKQVHQVLLGKFNRRTLKHDFLFRRLLRCSLCNYSLIGETHKGHNYYRCQRKGCPTTTIREDKVVDRITELLLPLQFTPAEKAYLQDAEVVLKQNWKQVEKSLRTSVNLTLQQTSDRLARLTDAYLDQVLGKEDFEQRKTTLQQERREAEQQLSNLKDGRDEIADKVHRFLELAGSAYFAYKSGFPTEKRELVQILFSNRTLRGKNLDFALDFPFDEVAKRPKYQYGAPRQTTYRTYESLLIRIANALESSSPEIVKRLNQPSFYKAA